MGTDFVYINTVRISLQRDINQGVPVADPTGRLIYSNRKRPYAPEFYNVQITESSSRSLYRAFTTTFNVRRPRFTIDTYYTLSWKYSYDDQEQDYSAIAYDSAANLINDYNYSLTDQRHQFIAYGIYTLPFNFEVSSTSRLSSARPFNAMPMLDYNKDDVFTDRPVIDGKVILRNAFRSRAFYDVSLRFQRHFSLPNENGRFTASVEFFNLFGFDNVMINHPHMMYGPGTVFKKGELVSVPPPATFNQLRDSSGEYYRDNHPGDPFQMQLGLRFQF